MKIVGPGYLIHQDPDGLFVAAWTSWRLPFMNLTPEQSRYRQELRKAIVSLRTDRMLHSIYTSEDNTWAADLENILFYNVGGSVFREVAKNAVRFFRKHSAAPMCPDDLEFTPRHHVQYHIESSDTWHHESGPLLARAEAVCKKIGDLSNVAGLWWSFKAGMSSGPGAAGQTDLPFTLTLRVSIPENRRPVNLAAVIKPLADAFISALHPYQGGQLDAVANRLAARLQRSPDSVRELLLKEDGTVLDPRAVPHLFREGVQWSPADHLLLGGEIFCESSESELITIKGELFAAPDQRVSACAGRVGLSDGMV